MLEALTPDCPGIVIVQHMPEKFTDAFARRLDKICAVAVKEARTAIRCCAGHVLIAPGGHHLAVVRAGTHYTVKILEGPPVSRHRPSVDVLFRSAAQQAGGNALGILLTGMGDDGARGLLELRARAGTPSRRTRKARWCSACPRKRSRAAPPARSSRSAAWRATSWRTATGRDDEHRNNVR